jgi:CheY-like chemotaxis protein
MEKKNIKSVSKGITILFVDDDPDDIKIFGEAVKEVDASIGFLSANSGTKALEMLGRQKTLPDYIFLDVNMPRMNGIQFLETVKKDKKFSSIPVIMYSTTKSSEHESHAKQLGAMYFFTKPIFFDDICNVIRGVINNSKPKKK